MTNEQKVQTIIFMEPGVSDTEIRTRTGITPHSQVNQICRSLVARGVIIRRKRTDTILGNYPSKTHF